MSGKRDRSAIYWKDADGVEKPVGRILGRENWTDADWEEDARRSKANAEAAEARKQALLTRGWELHYAYCSRDTRGEWAKDPFTGQRVTHADAYRIQETRQPGSVPEWPKFEPRVERPNSYERLLKEDELEPGEAKPDWQPPPSTLGLFDIGEVKVQPMKAPASSIFFLNYTYGTESDTKK